MLAETLKWLDDALQSGGIVGDWDKFHFDAGAGTITATNGRITACAPFAQDVFTGSVPGKELMRVVRAVDKQPTMELTDNDQRLLVKAGRFRAKLPVALGATDAPAGVKQWQPVPAALWGGLARVRPFVGENAVHPWSLGVALHGQYAVATNNVVFAGTTVPGMDLWEQHQRTEIIMPVWAVDFLLDGRNDAHLWAMGDIERDYIAFQWPNGAWMRSVVIDAALPSRLFDLLVTFVEPRPGMFAIDATWREAWDKIAKLADNVVDIYADHMAATYGDAEVMCDATSPVPEDTPFTRWTAKALASVVANASHIDLTSYPQPAGFSGANLFGCIAARR